MSHVFPTYARWNLEIKEAKGSIAIDQNGKSYLDFISGIAVCNLGHADTDVKQAVQDQLDKVWHVSNLFQSSLQEEVAEILTANSCGDAVFFCNSGAEANEAAIKLARKHTGKSKIVTFKQSFHGRTFAAMSATGQAKIHEGFGPLLPEFEYLPFNDIETLQQLTGDGYAAIMLEIIQGEGGVVPAEALFLEKIKETCKRLGALLIIDEVQTGIGRTGMPFAYQHHHLEPDIITAAKGLGSGFPVGAMIGKKELIPSFQPGSHGTTFGGNPLAMAAAKATLAKIFQSEFLEAVKEKSEQLTEKLQAALSDSPVVHELRGMGLMIGMQLDREAAPIITELRTNGLLALSAGPNVIRLLPPLTVTDDEINKAAEILESTIKQAAAAASH
ncbi:MULTISPECIES: acetylornithine transaminase [Bacillaceae]|uniref:acetylornithine transaminase n=1 Tax=Bacillaceae TaxID=186817 RepID=UPI000C78DED5|nr:MULTISPECIES: acetylornithine transaminase [Bacillaceae]PLR68936.1 acetylornithine transaminase [Bacillus sp. UMB0893]QNG59602.1 acetylornithine transaminase [Bacillus sp. PAMC26568]